MYQVVNEKNAQAEQNDEYIYQIVVQTCCCQQRSVIDQYAWFSGLLVKKIGLRREMTLLLTSGV
ncbi:hypothetical protein ACE1AT_08600 [Pelatocladus sp. BLCC-F211]|uniref:hypothetical protein n=1 Tax=Pelatocladus sp. BLCC-F211 TaxID=3342752 RepID=UPI0035B908ED